MPELGALGASLGLLLILPHFLPTTRVAPFSGIALWTSVLFLRAVTVVSIAAALILVLPATGVFTAVTHWCLHGVVPYVSAHLGLDGHRVGEAALAAPVLIIAVSVLSTGFALVRASRAVGRWLRAHSVGPGPGASVLVGDSSVVVASAGIRTPRVVVSAGALLDLDDAELRAAIEHEWAHVQRRHAIWKLVGYTLWAFGRPLPGSRRALSNLGFELERDADRRAVMRTGDPLALAGAICKATERQGLNRSLGLTAALASNGVVERVKLLVSADWRPTRWEGPVRIVAIVALLSALQISLASPELVGAGVDQLLAGQGGYPGGCS